MSGVYSPVRNVVFQQAPLEACPVCIEEAVLLTAIMHVTFIKL